MAVINFQKLLDGAQAMAEPNIRNRDAAVAYCNACINSGLGMLQAQYKSDDRAGEMAVYAVLQAWSQMVAERIQKIDQRAAKTGT